jgi:hypothetical protein
MLTPFEQAVAKLASPKGIEKLAASLKAQTALLAPGFSVGMAEEVRRAEDARVFAVIDRCFEIDCIAMERPEDLPLIAADPDDLGCRHAAELLKGKDL